MDSAAAPDWIWKIFTSDKCPLTCPQAFGVVVHCCASTRKGCAFLCRCALIPIKLSIATIPYIYLNLGLLSKTSIAQLFFGPSPWLYLFCDCGNPVCVPGFDSTRGWQGGQPPHQITPFASWLATTMRLLYLLWNCQWNPSSGSGSGPASALHYDLRFLRSLTLARVMRPSLGPLLISPDMCY
jgi:hypothetical protein